MTENVIVARVLEVKTHPDADLQHLSVLNVDGKTAIAGKMEDGSHRYPEGSLVVFLPVDTVIPLDLLEKQGFYWDAVKGRGLLKGNKRNRVGAVTRGTVTSEGILFPLENVSGSMGTAVNAKGGSLEVMVGDILNEFYGIETK